ncbi:MAG: DUF692 family multinuclear iron-containing protein [bacterium]
MEKIVSLGMMEQPVMRGEVLDDDDLSTVKKYFSLITHLESKHLDTIKPVRQRWKELGSDGRFLFHVQYPTEGGGTLNLVDPEFKTRLGKNFSDILEITRPEWISFHLGLACEKLISGGQFGFEKGDSPVIEKNVILSRIIENIHNLKQNFFHNRILLENLDYMPMEQSNGSYEHVCVPEFIKTALEETGCGMLLDVGHATVTGKNSGYADVRDYLNAIPLEKVVEIHMSGSGVKDGIANDAHNPITNPDQKEAEYLEAILNSGRMTDLMAITLETFENIEAQLDLLKNILDRTGYSIK